MPSPEPNETLALVDELTRDRLDLLAEREKLDRRIADIDQVLIEHLPRVGGRHELDGCPGQGVRLAPPRRTFSEQRAREMLDPTTYLSICVQKPNAARAREVLGNALVDQLYVVGDRPTVQGLRSGGDRR